eukprot:3165247-Rhodomonas_salina.1
MALGERLPRAPPVVDAETLFETTRTGRAMRADTRKPRGNAPQGRPDPPRYAVWHPQRGSIAAHTPPRVL